MGLGLPVSKLSALSSRLAWAPRDPVVTHQPAHRILPGGNRPCLFVDEATRRLRPEWPTLQVEIADHRRVIAAELVSEFRGMCLHSRDGGAGIATSMAMSDQYFTFRATRILGVAKVLLLCAATTVRYCLVCAMQKRRFSNVMCLFCGTVHDD
jgi:hypothetical protein